MSGQAGFAGCLLAPQPACPPGLTTWNGSDPGRRFAVYRNNVMVSLIDALADSFPVTLAMVGADFFRGMAALFARANPPRSPVMARYGAGFAEFIEGFAPAAALPYLPDLARLELLRVEAYHAADAEALATERIARLLAAPERLPQARFALHPALRDLRSAHAVASLWAAHQGDDIDAELSRIDTGVAESALVIRVGLAVEIHRVDAGTAAFAERLRQGAALGDAVGQARAADAGFEFSASMALLLRLGAVTGITP